MKTPNECEAALFKRAPRLVRQLGEDARRARRDKERADWKAQRDAQEAAGGAQKGRGW